MLSNASKTYWQTYWQTYCQTYWQTYCQTYCQTHCQTYDVVFLDPPFALALIHDVLLELQQSGCLNQSACIYVEQPQPLAALNLPDRWKISHHKRAGRVYYGLLQAYP